MGNFHDSGKNSSTLFPFQLSFSFLGFGGFLWLNPALKKHVFVALFSVYIKTHFLSNPHDGRIVISQNSLFQGCRHVVVQHWKDCICGSVFISHHVLLPLPINGEPLVTVYLFKLIQGRLKVIQPWKLNEWVFSMLSFFLPHLFNVSFNSSFFLPRSSAHYEIHIRIKQLQ